MKNIFTKFVLWMCACLVVLCGLILNGGMVMAAEQFASLQEIPESVWNNLAEKTLYFGHQSVGFNIIAGIETLMAEHPAIRLNLVKTTDAAAFDSPIFGHSAVGNNTEPLTKIDAFTQVLKNGVGAKVEIAFLKFCFIDFDRKTPDVEGIFSQYVQAMRHLHEQFPHLTIVHFTVPLTAEQSGPKAWLKKTLGKGANEDNLARHRFNALLKAEYEGKAPIFDIATIESTLPDGTRASLTAKDGTVYDTLVPEYTDDGGHLNETGRKVVAEALLLFLANMLE